MAGMMDGLLKDRIGGPPAAEPVPVRDEMDRRGPAELDDETPNVSPEEQEEFDQFVNAGLEMIYEGGEVHPSILEMLDEDPSDLRAVLGDSEALRDFSPVIALAGTTVMLVLEIVRRAGESRPSDAVILHGGKDLLEDLANLADTAGIYDYSQEEVNRAFLVALDLYREAASAEGLLDKAALAAEFEEIKAADAQGAFAGAGEV